MSLGSRQQRLSTILSGIACVLSLVSSLPAAAQSAEDAVTDLLSQRYFEVEFFVFERSAVMDFNTREILAGRNPQAYPSKLLALPFPDQPYGSGYQIDPMTRLCMTYPTLTYSINADVETGAGFEAPLDSTGASTGDSIADSDGGSDGDNHSDGTTTDPVSDSDSIDGEVIDRGPELIAPASDPMQELLDAVAEFELQLNIASNQWMPDSALTLNREARRVESRVGGRILFHGRWLQAVPPREAPLPIMLPAGNYSGSGKELTGSIGVTLGRYLHFQTRLNYAAPGLGEKPIQVALSPTGEAVPVSNPAEQPGLFMTMAQSRRMRSEELHYLDHPKLGVVVRIDPVTIPESLLALNAALAESPQ